MTAAESAICIQYIKRHECDMERIKKVYKNNRKHLSPAKETNKDRISEELKIRGYDHSFSPVYSRQYSYNSRSVTPVNHNKNTGRENNMEEIYQAIEEKIKKSGYKREVSGYDIYNELCDLIEDKDNGTYILMSKQHDDVIFEYCVEVLSDNFNLSYISIQAAEGQYHIDFDHE